MFWSDVSTDLIWEATLDGTNARVLVRTNITNVGGYSLILSAHARTDGYVQSASVRPSVRLTVCRYHAFYISAASLVSTCI